MLTSQPQTLPADSADPQVPIQVHPGHQPASDFNNPFDDLNISSLGPSGQPHMGFCLSFFDSPLNSIAGAPTYGFPDFSLSTTSVPSIDQRSDPQIFSHANVQPNGPLGFFADDYSFQLCEPFPESSRITPHPVETHLPTEGQNTSARQPATRGAFSSPRQPDLQAPPTGVSLEQPLSSLTEPRVASLPPPIPFHTRPSRLTINGDRSSVTNYQDISIQRNAPVNDPLSSSEPPIPAPPPHGEELLNPSEDENDASMPDWIGLVKPLPQGGENVVMLRRDTHVAFDIIPEYLPLQPPLGCGGIKIPATASVKNYADTTGKTLLEFRIRLYGATTKRLYETVCASCEKREGKKKGTPNLIDFKAESDMVEPKAGKIRVEFVFCCYPKDHQSGDRDYFLEVILSEDEGQENIVAQCRLPFRFNVVAKLPPGIKLPAVPKKRVRQQMETTPDLAEQRNVRPRVDQVNPLPHTGSLNNGAIRCPAKDPTRQCATPLCASNTSLSQDHSQSTSSLPVGSTRENALRSNFTYLPMPATSSSRDMHPPNGKYFRPSSQTNPLVRNLFGHPNDTLHSLPIPPDVNLVEEHDIILRDVNPQRGPISGGDRIVLIGSNFPTSEVLFAKFGSKVTPVYFDSSMLLICTLPPSDAPGLVDVTLSRSSHATEPSLGTSTARFHYVADPALLLDIVLRMQERSDPRIAEAFQQYHGSCSSAGNSRTSQGNSHQRHVTETFLNQALALLSEHSGFDKLISTTNDNNQTLAHLAVSLGYTSLLNSLVGWGIDIGIADVNGFTALHCAYLKGDQECIDILLSSGASELVKDNQGRFPDDLASNGFISKKMDKVVVSECAELPWTEEPPSVEPTPLTAPEPTGLSQIPSNVPGAQPQVPDSHTGPMTNRGTLNPSVGQSNTHYRRFDLQYLSPDQTSDDSGDWHLPPTYLTPSLPPPPNSLERTLVAPIGYSDAQPQTPDAHSAPVTTQRDLNLSTGRHHPSLHTSNLQYYSHNKRSSAGSADSCSRFTSQTSSPPPSPDRINVYRRSNATDVMRLSARKGEGRTRHGHVVPRNLSVRMTAGVVHRQHIAGARREVTTAKSGRSTASVQDIKVKNMTGPRMRPVTSDLFDRRKVKPDLNALKGAAKRRARRDFQIPEREQSGGDGVGESSWFNNGSNEEGRGHQQQHQGSTHRSPPPSARKDTQTTESDDDSDDTGDDGEHHGPLVRAAKEAERQRNMFAKLPRESYVHLRRRGIGAGPSNLTLLLNPPPEMFPQEHPYRILSRHSRSAGDIVHHHHQDVFGYGSQMQHPQQAQAQYHQQYQHQQQQQGVHGQPSQQYAPMQRQKSQPLYGDGPCPPQYAVAPPPQRRQRLVTHVQVQHHQPQHQQQPNAKLPTRERVGGSGGFGFTAMHPVDSKTPKQPGPGPAPTPAAQRLQQLVVAPTPSVVTVRRASTSASRVASTLPVLLRSLSKSSVLNPIIQEVTASSFREALLADSANSHEASLSLQKAILSPTGEPTQREA